MSDENKNDAQEDPIQGFMRQIHEWMAKDDNRPRELTLTCGLSRLPNGAVTRVFQMHTKALISQITELPQEQSRIVTPNGARIPKLG